MHSIGLYKDSVALLLECYKMPVRLYRMICLKRSECEMKEGYFRWKEPVYWMPNHAGYTKDRSKAGIYAAADVESAGGCYGDWVLEPVSRAERFPERDNDNPQWFIDRWTE